VYNNSRNVKIMFWILKKNVKKVKNAGFRGHLITPVFNVHNYRNSVPVSHQHETSLLRNADVVFTFTKVYRPTT